MLVTRHRGTVEWARRHGLVVDRVIDHLESTATLQAGDVVLGNLPVPIVAELTARGVLYVHLDLRLRRSQRGQELDADELVIDPRVFEATERTDLDVHRLIDSGGTKGAP
ncbi:CRISPR-associated protein Csx16 [Aciditerrimonas ferrireducens]|uniref:CRISPR-associated protein Csx16 n=1 Tax=Aciditerrimonas ferrireducens TaxID=667306 RepID=UPI0020042FCC|nr:CRISPR-associated protein Csx16 [Aciditerrimonas ferrireducens]MCK4176167.1 CRISPR-associated protein Csx16 [Aciditerrimonas ferrireducens]